MFHLGSLQRQTACRAFGPFPLGARCPRGLCRVLWGRGRPAPERRYRRGSGAQPGPARLRCSPGPSRAGALGPAVRVRGCAEGGAALGGRCGFISAAGRDARRRQGAASNRRRRGPAAPSPAQPSPTRPAAAGGRPRREPGARGEGGEAARTARRRPEGEERARRRAAGS